MKRMSWILIAALSATLAACGDDDDKDDGNNGFPQPAGTVVVNFVIDDTANQKWQSEELEWKGQVQYDPVTRIAHFNSDWNAEDPGWAKLYDDGPWTSGGHEPANATANDHKLGIAVFIVPPAAGQEPLVFTYGLRDATNPDRVNGGWMWSGDNGTFTVAPGATGTITAPGIAFPAKGAIDFKIVLDTANLAEGFTDPTSVKVKGSAASWVEYDCFDDATHGDDTTGDGKFTWVLSLAIDTESPPYPGLLAVGDEPEFVFVLDGVEYKVGSDASPTGVTAFVKYAGTTAWVEETVGSKANPFGGSNTYITVPAP